MSDAIEVPRCHYCERFAPEIQYKNISVCVDCLSGMDSQFGWRMYRTPDGKIIISDDDPDNLLDWELLETDDFKTLWVKSMEFNGSADSGASDP